MQFNRYIYLVLFLYDNHMLQIHKGEVIFCNHARLLFVPLFKIILVVVMLIISCKSFASESGIQVAESNSLAKTYDNLNVIDSDTNDLNQLKRKLEREKLNAEIKKIQHRNEAHSLISSPANNIQTTVTGVAIDQNGRKIAWLQFADGGTLTVNTGSQVGKYTVSAINMHGVTLTKYNKSRNHKHAKKIFLKRSYSLISRPTTYKHNINSNTFFAPSPVVTDANVNQGPNVPPIITSSEVATH